MDDKRQDTSAKAVSTHLTRDEIQNRESVETKIRKSLNNGPPIKKKVIAEPGAEEPSTSTSATANGGSVTAPAGQSAGIISYKIITVRKPDGSLMKVKRKIDPVEATKSKSTQQSSGVIQSKRAPPPGVGKKEITVVDETGKDTAPSSVIKKEHNTTAEEPPKENLPVHKTPDSEPMLLSVNAVSKDDIDRQLEGRRARKMHRFKTALVTGLITAIGGDVISGTAHIGDVEDGDEALSASDMSGDEYDDHTSHRSSGDQLGEHDKFGHEGETAHLKEMNNTRGIDINLGAAATGLAAAATMSQAPPQQPRGGEPTSSNAPGKTKPTAAVALEAAGADKSNDRDEKVTYKVGAKEVEEIEARAAKSVERPLQKHWANLTFYFLASLSILLPLLFLVLAIIVFLMDDKESGSKWSVLQDVIKVAISAWPIVFAAVVAQVFKTWATFRVERGIKLMELEQLVGSNSFASAVKQPLLLRRFDLLTIFLFLTWCFSPLGSQALQRSYTIDFRLVNESTTIHYLNMTRPNRVFSFQSVSLRIMPAPGTLGYDATVRQISTLYNKLSIPSELKESSFEDDYHHPFAAWLDQGSPEVRPIGTSRYGIPILLNQSIFDVPSADTDDHQKGGDARSEATSFITTSSYFNFTCDPWSVVPGSYFNDPSLLFTTSSSGTYHIRTFNRTANTSDELDPEHGPSFIDSMDFASVIRNGSARDHPIDALPKTGDASLHSLISCSFEQVFVDFGVTCSRLPSSDGAADCFYDDAFYPIRHTPPSKLFGAGAQLYTFGPDFAFFANPPDNLTYATTPNEAFLGLYPYDKEERNADMFNLSALASPEVFAQRMAYLFNTFVDIGNTLGYIGPDFTSVNIANYSSELVEVGDAWHFYTGPRVYQVDISWAVVFLVCVVLLLAAGCFSVFVESRTVAPDVLGYVSTVTRNSRYLQLPKQQLSSVMDGGERARVLGSVKVMMQDVKGDAPVGRIALGLKHEKARKLETGRLYR